MLKNLLGIFFIICLTTPMLIYVGYLPFRKHMARQEMKSRIKNNLKSEDLVLLMFHEKDVNKLQWKDSKEFVYQDQMYDLKEKKAIGDTVYLWCFWDHKESKINRTINRLLDINFSQIPAKNDQQQQLHNFFTKLFPINPDALDIHILTEGKRSLPRYRFHFDLLNISPDTPPPEMS